MHTDFAWDFDGTLCDSYPHILRCFRQTLEEAGIHDSDEHILSHITVTVGKAITYYQEHFGAPKEMYRRFHELDEEPDWQHVTPFPGVLETLQEVRDKGGRNLLYTHRHQSVMRYLDHYGMTPLFSSFVTGEDHCAPKPAPDGLRLLMERAKSAAENLVMVGDRSIDIDAAWNAGAKSCFFNSNGQEIPQHATWHVQDYRELRALLDKIMAS